MGSEELHCPDCGQPVETVVKRHKTLGAWVPTWVAGPCRNPECGAYAEGDAEHGGHGRQHEHHEQPEPPTAKNS
ncbi:hypothetical protein [Streptomyces sp. NPDC057623]|uniref:hypothetical protein n=1 Tax=Streptomyces sp. NPDC057623 TaxID=3346187 RepID=UPI0036D11327